MDFWTETIIEVVGFATGIIIAFKWEEITAFIKKKLKVNADSSA